MDLSNVFCELDFEKIESVVGVAFSKDVRRAIQHLMDKCANSEWHACTRTSPNQRILLLRQAAQDCRRYVESLRATHDNIRPRLPSPWQPLVLFRDSMFSVNDLCDMGNDLAEALEDIAETLSRRKVGRPRNDFERELIRGIYPLAKEAGVNSTAYPSRSHGSTQSYAGDLLDMVEEILFQIGCPYHSRDALAKFIIRQKLSSKYASAQKDP